MLHFITDASLFELRSVIAMVRGYIDEAAPSDPSWVVAHVWVHDEDAHNVLSYLATTGSRVQGWAKPKAAIADPVYAMAAANVDRGREGGSSTPALSLRDQAWLRR